MVPVVIPLLLTFVEACSIAMESLLYQETVSITFTFKCTFGAAQVPATMCMSALPSTDLVSFTRTRRLKTTGVITTLPILDDLFYSNIEINYLCVSHVVIVTSIFLLSMLPLVPF